MSGSGHLARLLARSTRADGGLRPRPLSLFEEPGVHDGRIHIGAWTAGVAAGTSTPATRTRPADTDPAGATTASAASVHGLLAEAAASTASGAPPRARPPTVDAPLGGPRPGGPPLGGPLLRPPPTAERHGSPAPASIPAGPGQESAAVAPTATDPGEPRRPPARQDTPTASSLPASLSRPRWTVGRPEDASPGTRHPDTEPPAPPGRGRATSAAARSAPANVERRDRREVDHGADAPGAAIASSRLAGLAPLPGSPSLPRLRPDPETAPETAAPPAVTVTIGRIEVLPPAPPAPPPPIAPARHPRAPGAPSLADYLRERSSR